MKVSQDFLRDFAYIANLYGWDAADIEDVKAQTRANPDPMRRYWTALAAAHRAGYQQNEANGYERLRVWAVRNDSPSGKCAKSLVGHEGLGKLHTLAQNVTLALVADEGQRAAQGRPAKSVVADDQLNQRAPQSGNGYHSAREGAA